MTWQITAIITSVIWGLVAIVVTVRVTHKSSDNENPEELRLVTSGDTMSKVHRGLRSLGMNDRQIEDAVVAMQCQGVYFREVE